MPHRMLAWARPTLEAALAFPTLNRLYGTLPADGRPFWDKALETLGVRYDVSPRDFERIPAAGPLLVVANHPFGALDGLALASLLRRRRPDARVMANFLLERIPDLHELLLAVDPFGSTGGRTRNAGALRSAARWLADGGALAMFPAGEVAHLQWSRRGVSDPSWSATAGWLARQARAAVLPVHFQGANSWRFQLAGLLHPALRTMLLPREMLRPVEPTLHIAIGAAIAPDVIARFDDEEVLTTFLRARTDLLPFERTSRTIAVGAPRPAPVGHAAPSPPADAPAARAKRHASWTGGPGGRLEREVLALPPEAELARAGEYSVHVASAPAIPEVLQELGRLRAVTFAGAGEGTGHEVDLDHHDEDYTHLFVWHRARADLVGAYRMALTDEVVARRGFQGLYASRFFRVDVRAQARLVPAIELGRSFVRAEFQREHAPLALLWRGIGHLVAERPRYRRLFGLVSISARYGALSRALLAAHLRATCLDRELSALVEARTPPEETSLPVSAELRDLLARDFPAVERLVEQLEGGRRAPVLLRQYLKLGAQLVGLNVDREFGHTLDALMCVDLLRVPAAVLVRHMGRPGAERFLRHHGRVPEPSRI
jgi:putative hemolysin